MVMVDGLSIILPAYNEDGNVALAVSRAMTVASSLAHNYEVVVVNDGSSDRTPQIMRALVEEHYPRVRLVSHTRNKGYGAALRTGFSRARYGFIFFTDADNQFDISEIQYFLPLMGQYDIVTGFRVYRYDTVLRSMISWLWNRLVGLLFRVRVRDVDCAFKLFRREALEKITVECDNFFASAELLARARKWNFRIAEKGVRHYPRTAGETTVRPSDIPRTLREVARMWQRIYFPNRRQLKAMTANHKQSSNIVEFTPAESVPVHA
jgi:glycosyltransferase involved in cell wall biosynthesis